MVGVWIIRVAHMATARLQGFNHLFGIVNRDDVIQFPVKDPCRYMLDHMSAVFVPAATHWYDGGISIRIPHRQIKGTKSAHTETGQVDAVLIHAVMLDDFIQQGCYGICLQAPVGSFRTLWRHHDKRKIRLCLHNLRHAVALDIVNVCPAFTGTMQKQDQRK